MFATSSKIFTFSRPAKLYWKDFSADGGCFPKIREPQKKTSMKPRKTCITFRGCDAYLPTHPLPTSQTAMLCSTLRRTRALFSRHCETVTDFNQDFAETPGWQRFIKIYCYSEDIPREAHLMRLLTQDNLLQNDCNHLISLWYLLSGWTK